MKLQEGRLKKTILTRAIKIIQNLHMKMSFLTYLVLVVACGTYGSPSLWVWHFVVVVM